MVGRDLGGLVEYIIKGVSFEGDLIWFNSFYGVLIYDGYCNGVWEMIFE